MRSFAVLRTLTGIVLMLLAGTASAQSQDTATPGLVNDLQRSLKIVEARLESGDLNKEEIDGIRRQVERVADSALEVRGKAMREVEEQTRLLNALGPKPGEAEPPDSPQVEAERQELEEAIADSRGRIKSTNLLLTRVDSLRTRLARAEFSLVAHILGERTETPLAPGLIGEAVALLPGQFASFREKIAEWWHRLEFSGERFGTLMWWLIILVVVVVVVVPVRNWVLTRYGPDHRDETPSFTRRFRVMLAVGLSNVVLPVVSIVGLYIVLLKGGAVTPDVREMASILMVTLAQYFLITGLSSAAMSPGFPEWRVSSFTNESAISLYRSIRLFAAVVVVVNLVRIPFTELHSTRRFAEILAMDATRDPLHTLFGAAALTAIALSMLVILRRDNWWFVQVDEDGQRSVVPPRRLVGGLMWVAKIGLVVGVAAALVGYINLGIFLAQRVVRSLLLIAFAYLFRAFIAASLSQAAARDESGIGYLLRDTLDYSKTAAARIVFWVMLVVDIALSVAVIIALLLIWGVQPADIRTTADKLLYGVNIGDYTLSLVDIGVALTIFVMLFFGVRLLQRFLSNRVLAQTVPDVGVRDALTTAVGYAGIIVAAFIAISSLGLELSQLAIIFGALSVGIGFGLQHVVNNFVSGLILLMHRPIKAGDWIVVGQNEGYVKKVNVVATEIQTFDNATVIVPNSQLVSSEVLNWTHKSTVARVIVPVGVAYDSDPEQVREVLLKCAEMRDDILKSPAPVVIFRDFGDSALMFELRFFIRQADYMLFTASDLRFDITEAFRKHGITIPFPQRDIHFKASATGPDELGAPGEGRGEDASPGKRRATRRRADEAEQGGDADPD